MCNAMGVLEFDRNEREKEFLCAVHGSDFATIIWDLDQEFLRHHLKYTDDKYCVETLQAVRDLLHELLKERGINLDYLMG